ASGVLFLTGPSGSPPNLQPISLREITDGLSNTILLGEKFHRDVVFDQITPASRSNLLMYQWSMWAWSGGFKGAGHVFGSAAVPINSRVASPPGSGFGPQDQRVNAWSSAHPNGANFTFCDGSIHFLVNNMNQATLVYLSTRGGGETIIDSF
ncbi:MAG TPA: DUF1559 domain-containing protein, partial [Pirellulaceae bacterium]|nr:DUF1559 domain-containing protein [Pirellulaceae bacterium]